MIRYIFELNVFIVIFYDIPFGLRDGFGNADAYGFLFFGKIAVFGKTENYFVDVTDDSKLGIGVFRGVGGVFQKREKAIEKHFCAERLHLRGQRIENVFDSAFFGGKVQKITFESTYGISYVARFGNDNGILFDIVADIVYERCAGFGKIQFDFVVFAYPRRGVRLFFVDPFCLHGIEIARGDIIKA